MDSFISNIENNDKEDTRGVLRNLLKTMKYEKKEAMICKIVEKIEKEKITSPVIESLLEPFDKEEDINKVVVNLCASFLCEKEEIKYICMNCKTLGDVLDMLILAFSEKRNVFYGIVAENILYCYSYDLTNLDIEFLLENLQSYSGDIPDEDMAQITDYLHRKRVYDREVYQAPFWVSLQEGENISLLNTVSVGLSDKNGSEVFLDKVIDTSDKFFEELLSKKEDTDDYESFTLAELPENIKESIKVFLQASSKIEEEDTGIKVGITERVWGPKNKMEDRGCLSTPNSEGPCRMLLCDCLQNFDQEDDNFYDKNTKYAWFTGRCDVCMNHIQNLSHAVRFPNQGGGWRGCFCSFECMTKITSVPFTKEENMLIEITKSNINTYGIMDRSSFC